MLSGREVEMDWGGVGTWSEGIKPVMKVTKEIGARGRATRWPRRVYP